jgi:hypothetical protein
MISVAQLDLDWNVRNRVVDLALTFAEERLLELPRKIGPTRTPRRCPACQSIIYSRRNKLCGVCSQPLPHALLFTHAEAAQVEQLLRSEQARHRQWLKQHERPGALR